MLGLRLEFTKEILDLIGKELLKSKESDSTKIVKLEEEIKSLKQTISTKDEEINILKQRLSNNSSKSSLSPTKKCVSLTRDVQRSLTESEKLHEFDPRLTKSMYVSIHDLPTQYSSSEEDDEEIHKSNGEAEEDKENESQLRISPRKSNILFSSQGSLHTSPKRKLYFNTRTKDLSPLKKKPRLEYNNSILQLMKPPPMPCFDKNLTREIEVSRSTEEEEDLGSQQNKNSNHQRSQSQRTNIHETSTQYSQSSDSVLQKEIMDYLQSSPTKDSNKTFPSPTKPGNNTQEEEQEVIEDSQEPIEDLVNISSQINKLPSEASSSSFFTGSTQPVIEIPPEYNTVILQRKYRLQFYIDKFNNDLEFSINFNLHPTKLIKWDYGDFIPNPNHQLDEQMKFIKRNNIKSEAKYQKFLKVFADKPEVAKFGKFEDVISQVFDKFQSPPGFMKSEFPDTQEQVKRKEIIKERQERRLIRRIFESTKVDKKGLQIGEFIFAIDIFNKYVVKDRYIIE